MDDPLTISIAVSGIGILVLFLALAFLCGLMYLMTAFIQDKPETRERQVPAERQEAQDKEQRARIWKRRAAVIAVALARAELEDSPRGVPNIEEAAGVSAWRAFHHQRHLTPNVPPRRTR